MTAYKSFKNGPPCSLIFDIPKVSEVFSGDEVLNRKKG